MSFEIERESLVGRVARISVMTGFSSHQFRGVPHVSRGSRHGAISTTPATIFHHHLRATLRSFLFLGDWPVLLSSLAAATNGVPRSSRTVRRAGTTNACSPGVTQIRVGRHPDVSSLVPAHARNASTGHPPPRRDKEIKGWASHPLWAA